jgi:hypothetical protein
MHRTPHSSLFDHPKTLFCVLTNEICTDKVSKNTTLLLQVTYHMQDVINYMFQSKGRGHQKGTPIQKRKMKGRQYCDERGVFRTSVKNVYKKGLFRPNNTYSMEQIPS